MKPNATSRRDIDSLVRQNIRHAKHSAEERLTPGALFKLRNLTVSFGFSIALDDVLWLDGKWYVTHAGLLRLAQRRHCAGIRVQQVREFCDSAAGRWVFKATLYKCAGAQGFVGYGDADPSNTSPLIRGAEMRVAETRAVNRALRKAYGIGLCSVEELGLLTGSPGSTKEQTQSAKPPHQNGSNTGNPGYGTGCAS